MAKKRAKVSEKTERADREARERLEHADMGLFDRFMKKLLTKRSPNKREKAETPKVSGPS